MENILYNFATEKLIIDWWGLIKSSARAYRYSWSHGNEYLSYTQEKSRKKKRDWLHRIHTKPSDLSNTCSCVKSV